MEKDGRLGSLWGRPALLRLGVADPKGRAAARGFFSGKSSRTVFFLLGRDSGIPN
jgi:hypothetical protein